MLWSRSNWRAISNPSAIPRMQADGILPPPNASDALTGRPKRKKAPRAWAPPNRRKFPPLSASRRTNRRPEKRAMRPNPNPKPSRLTQKQHPQDPELNPLPSGGPSPPIGVPGIDAEGAATILIVLLAARIILLVSENHARLDPRAVTHHHPPKK